MMVKEYDSFVPRSDLLKIIEELRGRLYHVSCWLGDALEALENESDLIIDEDGETRPNASLAALSAIAAEIKNAHFPVHLGRK